MRLLESRAYPSSRTNLLPPPRQIRAVLFDFVGTLTRGISIAAREPTHRRVAAALGCEPEKFRAVLGRSYFDRAAGRYGDSAQTMRWVARQAGVEPSRQQLAAAVALRHRTELGHLKLRPEAVPLLRHLRRQGLRLGVVSDCTHELPAAWPSLPIRKAVDTTVFSIEVGACKPDLAMYATACKDLDVVPDECLYIGDGGSKELTGATEAGMQAVQLTAPDLATHAAFARDREWFGPQISHLDAVRDLVGGPGL